MDERVEGAGGLSLGIPEPPKKGTHGGSGSPRPAGIALKVDQFWGGRRVQKEWIWEVVFGDRQIVSFTSDFGSQYLIVFCKENQIQMIF